MDDAVKGISPIFAVIIIIVIVIVSGYLLYQYMIGSVSTVKSVSISAVGEQQSGNPFRTPSGYVYYYTVTLNIANRYSSTLYLNVLNMTLISTNGQKYPATIVNLKLSTGVPKTLPNTVTLTVYGKTFNFTLNHLSNIIPSGHTTTYKIQISSPIPLVAADINIELVDAAGHIVTPTVNSVSFT